MAEAGAQIMLNGICDPREADRMAEGLSGEFRVNVGFDGADMRQPRQIQAMVERTQRELGSLDILVNNAGIQHISDIEHFPPEQWDDIIAVNLSAAFHGTRAAIPGMKARGWGRIINTASVHGLVGSAQRSAYVAAKHGIVGLTKVAAIELANTGITVNAICPGWVLTNMVNQQIERRAALEGLEIEAVQQQYLVQKQPMLRFTTPEQIAALAIFLCSEAAATITGAPLSMDGGWAAQ